MNMCFLKRITVTAALACVIGGAAQANEEPDVVNLVVSPANLNGNGAPDYAEGMQVLNADPSPGTRESNINNYINQDEQININPTDGKITVLRSDQKNVIHRYVTEVIPVMHANPREIVSGLRVVTGKEGGRAEVLINGANNTTGIQVICPRYQLPYIKQVVAALDKPWVQDFEDGSSAIYYKAKHRDITNINAVAFDAGTPDQAFLSIDEKNNAVYYHDDEGSIGGYMSIVEKVDVPAHQVVMDISVYEITEQDDEKLGLDYIAWKNGPGKNLFQFVLSGSNSYQRFQNVTSLFDPFVPARTVATEDGVNKIRTSTEQQYAAYNYAITAAFIDFLAVEGKARVVTSGKVLAKSGTVATFDRLEQLVAFTPSFPDEDNLDMRELNYSIPDVGVGFFASICPYIGTESLEAEITVDMSSFSGQTPQGAPIINHRSISSTAVMMDGQPYVLGGLTLKAGSDQSAGMPVLGDIPGLGLLFGGNSKTDRENRVLIVMTPRFMLGTDTSPAAPPTELTSM